MGPKDVCPTPKGSVQQHREYRKYWGGGGLVKTSLGNLASEEVFYLRPVPFLSVSFYIVRDEVIPVLSHILNDIKGARMGACPV